MIEPFFCLRERHRFRSDSLEDVRAWAVATLRIGEFFEQASAECIQDALVVPNRISSRVQIRLSFIITKRMSTQ